MISTLVSAVLPVAAFIALIALAALFTGIVALRISGSSSSTDFDEHNPLVRWSPDRYTGSYSHLQQPQRAAVVLDKSDPGIWPASQRYLRNY